MTYEKRTKRSYRKYVKLTDTPIDYNETNIAREEAEAASDKLLEMLNLHHPGYIPVTVVETKRKKKP